MLALILVLVAVSITTSRAEVTCINSKCKCDGSDGLSWCPSPIESEWCRSSESNCKKCGGIVCDPATAPVAVPTAPVAVPTAPVAVPTAPVAVPTAPVAVPTAPVAVPTAPVAVPTAPVAVPTAPVSLGGVRGYCLYGILGSSDTKCCAAECGECGGSGCGDRPGGASKCCTSKLVDPCTDSASTACAIPATGSATPVSSPVAVPTVPSSNPAEIPWVSNPVRGYCKAGIIGQDGDNSICCPRECGQCGGPGCAARPGGKDNCCTTSMVYTCENDTDQACIIPSSGTASTGPALPEYVPRPAVPDVTKAEIEACFKLHGANEFMLDISPDKGQKILVFPDDGRYNFWRRGTNGHSEDYFPQVVVVPQENKDIQAAVKCGNQLDLKVNIKSGGHSYETGYVTDGILIDNSDMNNIIPQRTDLENYDNPTFGVEAGVKLARFAALVIQEEKKTSYGVTAAFTSGGWVDVGVAGHALCGGYGTFGRLMGYLGDMIVAMEIVDSDGNVKWIDEDNEGILFDRILGVCSQALGIVVSIQFKFYRMNSPYITSVGVPVEANNPEMRAKVFEWATAKGSYADNRYSPIYNTAKDYCGGHFMGTREEAVLALWNDDIAKAVFKLVGYDTSLDDPKNSFKQKTLEEYWILNFAKETQQLDEMLAIKRRTYESSKFYLSNLLFDESVPLDIIDKYITGDGPRSRGHYISVKVRGGNDAPAIPYYLGKGNHKRGMLFEIHIVESRPLVMNQIFDKLQAYSHPGAVGYVGYAYLQRPTNGELGKVPFGDLYWGKERTKEIQEMRDEHDPNNRFGSRYSSLMAPVTGEKCPTAYQPYRRPVVGREILNDWN